nr:hypothetical protein [Tanacetum cinerariifolium]
MTRIESLVGAIGKGISPKDQTWIVKETSSAIYVTKKREEGDIRFLEELLIDDSIISDELSDANFEENPLIPRPPPKPPDVETDAGEEIVVVMIDKDKFDDDYQNFMFDKVFSLLSAESEDTIFDPGLFLEIEVILCRIYVRFPKSSYPFIDSSLGSGPPGEDKEHEATTDTELLSTEDIHPLVIQEPPRESNICQLIKECCIEVPEEQKQNMEKTMLDLVKICHHKQFLCIHDDVDNLMESALDSKLLSINSINSQRLDKKEQEIKIVEEQPTEHTPILSTKEPENSLSMRYEHLSITPEMESDEVTKSNAKNLLPIPSECEVALEDKRECDLLISENSPACDNHSDTFSDSKIDDDISVYDDDFEDIEHVEASLPDQEIVKENGIEEENVVQREEEEDNPSNLRPPPEPPDDNFDLPRVVPPIEATLKALNDPNVVTCSLVFK